MDFSPRIERSSWCGDDAGTVCWPAFSRGFHFNRQSETCASDLVLECKPHKLSFALVERFANRAALFGLTALRPCSMSQRCDLDTPRSFANSARLRSSASRRPDSAAPRVSGPPIRPSRNLDASRRPFPFVFLVVMFVDLLDVDQLNGASLTFLVYSPVRIAQTDCPVPFPSPFKMWSRYPGIARAVANPSTDTRSTQSANF